MPVQGPRLMIMMIMMRTECKQKMSGAVLAPSRSRLLMVVTLSMILGQVFCSAETSEKSKDSGFQNQWHIGDVSLGEEWGLPDTEVEVGRLLYYQLPRHHTTLGNCTNYKVTIAKEDSLPLWLTFNEQLSSIEGVPTNKVAGQTYILLVLADCTKPSGGGRVIPVKEYFTIHVSDKEDPLSSGKDYMPLAKVPSGQINDFRFIKCQPNAAVTMVTVIIDADEESFLAKERVHLLRKFSSHLGLPVSVLRLAPSRAEHPIFDDSILVAGPGDIKHPKHSGLLIQWNVGCGNVFAEHMPVLELLEVTSSNGTITKAIGCGVVGWHITSNRPQQQRRLKRQLHPISPTATAVPSIGRPTGQPVPTMTVSDEMSNTNIPENRVSPKPTLSVSTGIISKHTKSPIPITTYVTITPTRVLSTTPSTVSVTKRSSTTPSWPVDVFEPSLGTEETIIQFHSTDELSSWIKTALTTDIIYPSPVTTISVTSSKQSTSKATKRPPKTLKTTVSSKMTSNVAPVVSKPLAKVEAVVGNLLFFPIPDDLFMDREDGGVENLTLLFLQDDDHMVDPPSWIKLNETSRTLYGLPLEEHIGMHYYQLAAADRQGKLAKTLCNVSVQPHPASNKLSHELSVTLDLDFDKVVYDLETRVNLINKIAAAFGDRDASKMTITKISPGSVVISWTNNTIPFEPCPEKEIRALIARLLLPDETINETFAKAMEPYRVLKAHATHIGSCAHLDIHKTSAGPGPDEMTTAVMPKGIEVKPREQPESNLLLLILIPIIIVAVLLLILIIICAICYRKQKRRQKEQDKLSGLHKGIPIIFADELDEKPDTPTSTLKSCNRYDEEKQSVPPPEYPRSKPASQSSTLRSDYKSPLLTDNEDDEEQDEHEEELGNGSVPPTLPTRRPRPTQ